MSPFLKILVTSALTLSVAGVTVGAIAATTTRDPHHRSTVVVDTRDDRGRAPGQRSRPHAPRRTAEPGDDKPTSVPSGPPSADPGDRPSDRPSVVNPTPSDDGPPHDAGDDHGVDGPSHDAGDDHGGRDDRSGHGGDDGGRDDHSGHGGGGGGGGDDRSGHGGGDDHGGDD